METTTVASFRTWRGSWVHRHRDPTTNSSAAQAQDRGQMAERAGFEPAVPFGTHDFQSCTFVHSVTSPGTTCAAPRGARARTVSRGRVHAAGENATGGRAERAGFEPAVGVAYNRFRVCRLRPLGHLSAVCSQPVSVAPRPGRTSKSSSRTLRRAAFRSPKVSEEGAELLLAGIRVDPARHREAVVEAGEP